MFNINIVNFQIIHVAINFNGNLLENIDELLKNELIMNF